MLKFKDGVVWKDMHPRIEAALPILDEIYQDVKTECVVTSGRDGKHMEGSLHYEGKALDIRTYNVLEALVKEIKDSLGVGYDVILEKDHIHIEWDPKQ